MDVTPYNTLLCNAFQLSSPLAHRRERLHVCSNFTMGVWTDPVSLAATQGIDSKICSRRSTFDISVTRRRTPDTSGNERFEQSSKNSFSFPLGTEMFHFPRCPSCSYLFTAESCGIPRMVFPHSEISGSKVVYHLPEAYRRLLRPSSAYSVEPSSVCS
jgi:hypothetical protein